MSYGRNCEWEIREKFMKTFLIYFIRSPTTSLDFDDVFLPFYSSLFIYHSINSYNSQNWIYAFLEFLAKLEMYRKAKICFT